MHRSLLKFCLLVCLLVLTQGVAAQYFNSEFFRETHFSGRIVDSQTREPLSAAVISVIESNNGDNTRVRNYTTDAKGQFEFSCTRAQSVRMEISFLGYKLHTVHLTTDAPSCDLGVIRMAESPQGIDDVVVKARMELFRIKGDTIIYLPRAVNTMEGDKALEILRQMPGVEVSDGGSVTVAGKKVERTYVNNRMLFGEDPATALKQLDASEVASIQTYDEVDADEEILRGKDAKRRKVLNVVTFKQFSKSLSADLLAAAGTDFNRDAAGERPARYNATGAGGYYSEELQAEAKGEVSNLTQSQFGGSQPGSRRTVQGEASIGGVVDKTHRYNASYQYGNSHSANRGVGRYDFYPTEQFSSKQTADTTSSSARDYSHNILSSYSYTRNGLYLGANLSGSITDGHGAEQTVERTDQNGALLLRSERRARSANDNSGFNWSMNAGKRFKSGRSFSAVVSIRRQHATSDRTDLRQDSPTAADGSRPADLHVASASPQFSASGMLSYNQPLSKFSSFSFRAGFNSDESDFRTTATDMQTGEQSLALSEDRTEQRTSWETSADYRFRKNKHSVNLSVGYNPTSRSYENRMTGHEEQLDNTYHLLTGRIGYDYFAGNRGIGLAVSKSPSLPSSGMLSRRIDDSSPLFLRAGNPALRTTNSYSAYLSAHFLSGQGFFNFSLNAELTAGAVANKYLYFSEDTRLPQYDNYTALAGATLVVPENAGNELGLRADVSYKNRIAPLRCFVELMAGYGYRNPQEDLGNGLRHASNHSGTFTLLLTTNFSRLFRITLGSTTTGTWNRNSTGVADHSLREQVSTTLRWDFLRRCFFTGTYQLEINRYQYSAADSDNHLLHFSAGCRLFNRRGTLSFNAYDVLNQNTGLSVGRDPLGTSYRWNNVYASLFTFSFEYKINDRR